MSGDGERLCAGFFLGHPATGPQPEREASLRTLLAQLQDAGRYDPPGVFAELEAALLAARRVSTGIAPQALWLSVGTVLRVRAEVDGTAVGRMLHRRCCAMPAAVAAGHDVVGFGGDLRLSFAREDRGLEVCRELGLPPDPPPFLPNAATARRVAADLNSEELGAPVLWVRCWRTVHAALD